MTGRYAVYFVPPQKSKFHQLGASLLARSVFYGETIQPRQFDNCPGQSWDQLVTAPSFYGFHATIKAPFELKGSLGELRVALGELAAQTPAFKLPKLKISFLDHNFLALTLTQPAPKLAELEKKCLINLNHLSAPLGPDDLNRRGTLAPHLFDNLKKWGYHLVLNDFKFHLTLTGPIHSKVTAAALIQPLTKYFQPILDQENIFDRLTLLYQKDRQKPFMALEVFPLNGE